ncbi:MAG: hypothetical protein U0W40_15980 [Acidimicrobiia bacterium]
MKRVVILMAAVLAALPVLALGAVPAGAAKADNCDLLTKKQASKILGHKVVATKLTREASTGAEQCEWRTNYYFPGNFKKLGAPYKLKVTTQPLTADVEKTIATLKENPKSEAVPELGDDVFFTASNELVAVVDPLVVQFEVSNYTTEGGSYDDIVYGPPKAAAAALLPLFADATKK